MLLFQAIIFGESFYHKLLTSSPPYNNLQLSIRLPFISRSVENIRLHVLQPLRQLPLVERSNCAFTLNIAINAWLSRNHRSICRMFHPLAFTLTHCSWVHNLNCAFDRICVNRWPTDRTEPDWCPKCLFDRWQGYVKWLLACLYAGIKQ